jgi:hypothetical protein
VASKVSSGDANDILLLDNVSVDDSPYEVPEPEPVITTNYLPAFVSLGLVIGEGDYSHYLFLLSFVFETHSSICNAFNA